MKRILIAVVAGLVVFGGTFAFADGLGGVATGAVGDSATVVASCDTDGVTANFGAPNWDATNKRYGVSTLNVASINAACSGDIIKVTLKDSSGSSLGEATGTVAAGAASLTFSASASASAVAGIDVVIAG
ncbi:MAG TPA: hypothetical protein VKP14_11310 [Gaiellaceae bacterium]|nr:hypothetical protein [Gaiellaceae bacterium]